LQTSALGTASNIISTTTNSNMTSAEMTHIARGIMGMLSNIITVAGRSENSTTTSTNVDAITESTQHTPANKTAQIAQVF